MSDHHPHHAPVRSSPYISEYDHHHHHIRLVTSNNGDDALLSHDALLDEKDNGHHLLPPPSTGAEELRKCGCDPPNPICPRKLHRATQKYGFSGVRYLPFWQRPHPRQEWIEHPTADANSGTVYVNTLALSHEHRAASASDLVLDLVFVVLLAGLGRSFRAELSVGDSAEHTKIAVRDFVSLFLPMYLQWSAILKFLNQCETRDVINIIFFIGNFLLMAAAGVSSERCGNATSRKGCKEYAWSIAGARLWVVLFTLHFIWYNRKYARCLLVYTSFDCLVLLSWLVTGFMPGGEECGNVINECWGGFVALWWFAISIDLIRAFGMELLLMCGLHLGTADVIPVNTALLAERYQLFVILSIGEVVTASLASDGYSGDARRRLGLSEASQGDDEHDDGEAEESSSSAPRINVVLLIIGLALLTKLYYFDVPDCAEPQPSGTPAVLRKHALATSATRGMMWIFHHLPFNMAIVMCGAVLEPLKLENHFYPNSSYILAVCLATIVMCCTCFEASASGGGLVLERQLKAPLRVSLQVAFALAMVLVPVIKSDSDEDPATFLSIMLGLFAGSVGTAFYAQGTLLFREVHPFEEAE